MNPSRELVPLSIADLSLFSKNLRRLLGESGAAALPGHVVLLNLLAKSAGHRNYQTLRVAPRPEVHAEPAEVPSEPIVLPRGAKVPRETRRALGHFDTAGRLLRWPTQFAVQQRALWALWVRLPAKRDLTEADVNRYLGAYHAFGDPATLRRELVNARLLWRTPDCRTYRKEMRRPGSDEREFLAMLLAANG